MLCAHFLTGHFHPPHLPPLPLLPPPPPSLKIYSGKHAQEQIVQLCSDPGRSAKSCEETGEAAQAKTCCDRDSCVQGERDVEVLIAQPELHRSATASTYINTSTRVRHADVVDLSSIPAIPFSWTHFLMLARFCADALSVVCMAWLCLACSFFANAGAVLLFDADAVAECCGSVVLRC